MSIDLSDRRVAAAIAKLVRAEVEAAFRARAPVIRYGQVFGPAANGKVAVRLLGQPEPSPGFTYGQVKPDEGQFVRVVIDPRGDRYVDEVMGEGLRSYFSVAPGGQVSFHDLGDPTSARIYLGEVLGPAYVQYSPLQGVEAVWFEPGIVTSGPIFGRDLSLSGAADFRSASLLLAPAAKRLRYVALSPLIAVFTGATTTADIGVTATPEITGLPTNAYAAYGQIIVTASDTSGPTATIIDQHSGDSAGTAFAPGVAGRFGAATFIAGLGGTNNRQLLYTVDWVSGTVTYTLRVFGYWTFED